MPNSDSLTPLIFSDSPDILWLPWYPLTLLIFSDSPHILWLSWYCLEHVTNFQDPDFLSTIISDLTKMKFQLRKKLQPAVVLDGIELGCGTGCGREKVEQTLRAGWALDPVHPTSHVYAKMALNLIEKVANPGGKAESRKRKGSEDSGSGSGSQYETAPQSSRSNSQSHRDPVFNRYQGGNQHGANPVDNRRYPPVTPPHQNRGRASSVSSRGSRVYSGSGDGGLSEGTGTSAASAADSGIEGCPGGGPGLGGNLRLRTARSQECFYSLTIFPTSIRFIALPNHALLSSKSNFPYV